MAEGERLTPDQPALPSPRRHRAAVLGSPIAHSLSPVLHHAAYAELGLTGWTYGRQEVREDGLAAVLDGLDVQWAGLSLTMPLKRAVIPLLDEVDDLVEAVGAVNTVLVAWSGSHRVLLGRNTDVSGILRSLAAHGAAPDGRVAQGLVVGGGATAASAVAALLQAGCARPAVRARSLARSEAVRACAERLGADLDLAQWAGPAGLARSLAAAPVVVSTLPAGAADDAADVLAGLGPDLTGSCLLDVVYAPWPTRLAAVWAGLGGRVIGGAAMLLHQACTQVELMTGRPAPVRAMQQALTEAGATGL